ncbi:MAG: alpha/beta fold hydrolase [Erythrobacter sp.]
MRAQKDETRRPELALLLSEIPNLALIWSSPVRRVKLAAVPKAAQRPPVLVFPGILSHDTATSLMRRTLKAAGYPAYGSRLGIVTGVSPEAFAEAEVRLDAIYRRHGEPVVLIGVSLGGIYCRVLAQRHPDKVRLVITLGTPFSGDRRANNAWRVYEAINRHPVDDPPMKDDPSAKPEVPTIAVWSRADGIIAAACARGEEGERDLAIEVPETHFQFSASRRSIARIMAILDEQLAKDT